MAVYVDKIFMHGGSSTFRWKESCHLFADSENELHALARKIGLRREWFQNKNDKSFPHYDLTKSRRALALKHGAIQMSFKCMVKRIRKRREELRNKK